MDRLKALREMGQSIWLDYISRNLITSGELKRLVESGVSGLTSNPSIFQKAIATTNEYDNAIRAFLASHPEADTQTLYEHLAIEDIQGATDTFRPVYEASDGIDGLVSLEVSPHLADDTRGTITEAKHLWKLVNRPNLMIKVPATPEGIKAAETIIAEGVNVNFTLIFSLKHYEAVSRAYLRGIARNREPHNLTSVASVFVSRVDTYVDKELEKTGTPEALALRGKSSVANAKTIYHRFCEIFSGEEFATQRKRGARIQRALWGSTSTKNPAYCDILYVQELIGKDTINTIPLETINAFCDHGQACLTAEEGLDEAKKVLAGIAGLGISLEAITEQLQKDWVKAFADSFDQLLNALEEKRKQVSLAR